MSTLDASDYKLKRFELWIGLVKFLSGTVVLGCVSAFLNYQYQSSQIKLEEKRSAHDIALAEKKAEFEYLSKFIAHAMDEDLEVRIRLADYMRSAALSGNIKEIWHHYHEVLLDQKNKTLAKRDELKAQEKELAAQLASIEEDNQVEREQWIEKMDKVRKDILYLQDQLDRRKYGSFQDNYIDVSELYQKARAARLREDYQRALTLLREGLLSGNDSLEYLFLSEMAVVYRAMRDFSNAEKYAQMASSRAPKDASTLIRLAIMQKNNNKINQAINTLQQAENISSGLTKLNVELIIAGYLVLSGKESEGMNKFKAIQAEVEQRKELLSNLAWFRAVAGPEDEFYHVLENALKHDTQGKVLNWIRAEVDLDKYRDQPQFIELLKRYQK